MVFASYNEFYVWKDVKVLQIVSFFRVIFLTICLFANQTGKLAFEKKKCRQTWQHLIEVIMLCVLFKCQNTLFSLNRSLQNCNMSFHISFRTFLKKG